MTNSPSATSLSPREQRRQRKALLEAQIEQQRVDLMVAATRWRTATSGIDDTWRQLQRFKAPLYAVGGYLLLHSARRPSSLLRVAKRVVAGVLLMRRAQRLLRLTRG